MRVLQLTDHLEVGGLEKIVVKLANAVSDRGGKSGLAAERRGALWNLVDDSVQRMTAPSRRRAFAFFPYCLWLRHTVRRDKWNVIHAHQRGVALMAKVATLGMGVAVVEHVHNIFPRPSLLRKILSFRGDVLISCGSAVTRMLEIEFSRPASRIHTVLNSVPDHGAGLDLELPWVAGSGTLRVLGIGRLSEQKDPCKFVEVAECLATLLDAPVEFVWIGDGEDYDDVAGLISRCSRARISIVKFSPDVPGWLYGADILLLTSKWEGLPLVVLEAMALGRVVVAHNVGSVSDIVEDGISGRLLEQSCPPEMMADVVREIVAAGELPVLGAGARTAFIRHGSEASMMDRIIQLYYSRCGSWVL